jgi:rubrerythrin
MITGLDQPEVINMLGRFMPSVRRSFNTLSEQEILALAISSEEDDSRIYKAYADGLRADFPASAKVFDEMAEEENRHKGILIDKHKERFGDHIPLIRREHVRGYYERKADWLIRPLSLEKTRDQAAEMERQAERFYRAAAARATDADTRKLLGDLALAEAHHEALAIRLSNDLTPDSVIDEEAEVERKQFLLTYVQPGLAGLMDGSISTLAPIFAAAFATGQTWETFLVGLSASVGAGISMGFTEAAHDDGVLTGRGSPIKRGLASGIMTTLGGLGHALPYLITDFVTATTVAIAVVFFELWLITWIQNKFLDTPWPRAMLQVVLGGSLVFAAGILIGHA